MYLSKYERANSDRKPATKIKKEQIFEINIFGKLEPETCTELSFVLCMS